MNPLLKLSTPAATGAFLVVGVTGLMMFFHLAQEQVEEMHQWFGIGMVAALLLHIARNWAALKGYPKRGPALWVALGLAVAGACGFLGASILGGEEGGGGGRGVFQALEAASIAQLAPIFGSTPEALVTRLQGAGLQGVTADASPAAIAAASGVEARAVMEQIAEPPRP